MGLSMDTKIFDTLLEPTFLIDTEGKIVYCNEPAALISDQTLRKLLRNKSSLLEIFNFHEHVSFFDDLKSIKESSPYQEVAFSTLSGKQGKVQITIQPFSESTAPTWLVYFRDVTLEETLQKKYRTELEQKEGVIEDLKNAQVKLKNYSENLEQMVEERTSEVNRLNQTMHALLDSLAQGFFIFDKEGTCLDVYSRSCISTIEINPNGKKIWDVLRLENKQISGFQKWMTTLFAEMLPFSDLAPLGPQTFANSEGKHIQLEYYPIKNSEEKITGVVVVATDVSSLVIAKNEAELERANAKMILSLVKYKRPLQLFIKDANEILAELQLAISVTPFDDQLVFRLLHTLKGGAATFSIASVASLCHQAENLLQKWQEQKNGSFIAKIQEQIQLIQENFSNFQTENKDLLGNSNQQRHNVEVSFQDLFDFVNRNQLPTTVFQDFSKSFLMEPIEKFISHFNSTLAQVAENEGKSLFPLKIKNADLRIYAQPYESLFSSLTHAFRNAVDHGIESAEQRISLGKNPMGTISAEFEIEEDSKNALQKNKWLKIQIKDDGQGISPEIIRNKLLQKGISCANESDEQIIQHVFDSQFSTRENVTQTSGRGVGMDSILFEARKLGGSAIVKSTPAQGTTLVLRVPYLLPEIPFKKSAA